jgi:preprotein translocase subunit SecF
MGYYEKTFGNIDYRILTFVPLIIALLLTPFIMNVSLGIDFTGGTEVQILTERDISEQAIRSQLGSCVSDLRTSVQSFEGKTSIILKTKQNLSKDCLDSSLTNLGFTKEERGKIFPSTFKPELGKTLFERGQGVLVMSFTLMALIVLIAFRNPIPCIAVISAALLDIVIAIEAVSLMGIELNLAGVAALLMLIGYSVDTDIMLTSTVLKEANKPFGELVNNAFSTGIAMTGTTIGAMVSIILVTALMQIAALQEIALVIISGLLADLGTTWLMNVGILQWYMNRKKTGRFKSPFKLGFFRT